MSAREASFREHPTSGSRAVGRVPGGTPSGYSGYRSDDGRRCSIRSIHSNQDSADVQIGRLRRPSRLVAFALAICNSSKVRYSISSSSSCSKVHPKLNYPFLSDALCDMFHPWRREVSLKCVVSIDTSILREQLCAVSTTTLSSSLSPRACWRLLAA